MKTIYKYTLAKNQEVQEVPLPEGALFKHVQFVRDDVQMWFMVDTDRPDESRNFALYTTGAHVRGEGLSHMGTCVHGSGFVFHVFERLSAL